MSGVPTFREINGGDMQAIFDLRIATWHNDRGREELRELGITHRSVREMLAESHRGWLCEADSGVLGFAMGNRKTGEMWVIAVLKNQGGKALASACSSWSKSGCFQKAGMKYG